MSDIIKESMNDLRKESIILFLKNHATKITVIIFLIAAGITAYNILQDYRTDKLHKRGASFLESTLKLNNPQSLEVVMNKLEELNKENDTIYSDLSRILYASISMNRHNIEKAKELYQEIINNNRDRAIIDYAKYMELTIKLEDPNISTEKTVEELREYINTDPVFLYSASELLYSAYLALDRKEEAQGALLAILNKPNIPEMFKARAKELIASIAT